MNGEFEAILEYDDGAECNIFNTRVAAANWLIKNAILWNNKIISNDDIEYYIERYRFVEETNMVGC